MEAARAVFHQRFAAKDFRAIVENSFDTRGHPFTAEGAKMVGADPARLRIIP